MDGAGCLPVYVPYAWPTKQGLVCLFVSSRQSCVTCGWNVWSWWQVDGMAILRINIIQDKFWNVNGMSMTKINFVLQIITIYLLLTLWVGKHVEKKIQSKNEEHMGNVIIQGKREPYPSQHLPLSAECKFVMSEAINNLFNIKLLLIWHTHPWKETS